MDDVNKEKFVHTTTCSIVNKKVNKSLENGRRLPSKNPYKVKPKMQLFGSSSQRL